MMKRNLWSTHVQISGDKIDEYIYSLNIYRYSTVYRYIFSRKPVSQTAAYIVVIGRVK